MSNAHLCTAVALHDEILRRTKEISGKVYLFFDEIQEVADWEKCINSFRVELDCDIYITGSNAKLLSGELATYLAGRYVEFVIYPFSFREFMELYHTVYEGADERQCFTKYLTLGGMPYLSNLRYDDAASRQYLRDLFNSVELKDIIKRNNIRDVDMLERIIAYITSNIGTTFSSTAISKYLKSEGRSVSPEISTERTSKPARTHSCLSGEAPRPPGKENPDRQREILCCRSWCPGSRVRWQHEGH